MQKIIVANIHRIGGSHLLGEVERHIDDGWRVTSITPIIDESDGGSYTRQLVFLLETDFFSHIISDDK